MWHDILTSIVAALCVWAIVSPGVQTGILGTLGLGLIACAALWSMDDGHDPASVFDAAMLGIGCVVLCIAWRVWRRHRQRLAWQHTDVMLEEMGASEHSHIAGGKQ